MRLRKDELGWLLLLIIICASISWALGQLYGGWVQVAWAIVTMPSGWFLGTYFREKQRSEDRVAWRESHPGISDDQMPSRLKAKKLWQL